MNLHSLSALERPELITKLKNETFDLLIVGGGISGAGVARNAASRGMKVALIEAKDFASGTSSKSSKLIHGGIRYLENLEFKLVFEALSERAKLFEMAPHLVHPLRFTLPVYEDSRVGMFKLGLGMWLYDVLSLFRTPELHERLSAKEVLNQFPVLKNRGLVGAYVYSDAYMDDDRLVLETLRSAQHMGATCVNYIKAGQPIWDESGQRLCGLTAQTASGESIEIRAQHIVSTVGPWTDELGAQILPKWENHLRPSKGIHITLTKERFPLANAVVMAVDKEDRIVFGIPRNDMVIVGTTDTEYKKSPNEVVAEKSDVEYLLKIVNEYFPGSKITKKDIIATYAGVRPLVKDEQSNVGKTSREHAIWTDPHNITFVAGGKYTTYRLISEQVVDHLLKTFNTEQRVKFAHSKTEQCLNPLVTSESLALVESKEHQWAKEFELKLAEIKFLTQRHGFEAKECLAKYRHLSNNVWEIEAWHAIHSTMCLHLVDFYTRRVPLFLSHADHGLEWIDGVAEIFSKALSWSQDVKEAEIKALKQHIDFELASLQ